MNIWFKKKYCEDILSGRKTTTIRIHKPKFGPGEIVDFAVGPRKAFTRALIKRVEEIRLKDLPAPRRKIIRELFEPRHLETTQPLWLITFKTI